MKSNTTIKVKLMKVSDIDTGDEFWSDEFNNLAFTKNSKFRKIGDDICQSIKYGWHFYIDPRTSVAVERSYKQKSDENKT